VGESGNHWYHADQNEGRQKARTKRQHDGDARALCGSLCIGAKRSPSIVGKMHEDVGQCRARMMRTNNRASDRCPARVTETVCPRGFNGRPEHRKPRHRRQHVADLAVESFSDRSECRRKCSASCKTRGKQVEGARQLPPDRSGGRTGAPLTRAASQNYERRGRSDRAAKHQAADEPGQQTNHRTNRDGCPPPRPADTVRRCWPSEGTTHAIPTFGDVIPSLGGLSSSRHDASTKPRRATCDPARPHDAEGIEDDGAEYTAGAKR